jgi:hypothetical protein
MKRESQSNSNDTRFLIYGCTSFLFYSPSTKNAHDSAHDPPHGSGWPKAAESNFKG